MPEYLKALIVVLGIAIPVLVLAKGPVCASGVNPKDYASRARMWVFLTLLAFFAHSFWIYAIVMTITTALVSRRDPNPLALYCTLLFVLPPFLMLVPGFGPIDHLVELDHIRLLNISILLPFALRLRRDVNGQRSAADVVIVLLLLYMFAIRALHDPPLSAIRNGLYLIIDIWLPYYVASRSLKKLDHFKGVAAALCVAIAIVAAIAIFETVRYWLLYESLRSPLGVPHSIGLYLDRGEGSLRARVTGGHPIPLGFMIMVGIGMLFYLLPWMSNWKRTLAGSALIGGLIATFSRGPWVGGAVTVLLALVSGPGVGKRVYFLGVGGALLLFGLLVTPIGQVVIAYLPFVGTVDAGTVDYRVRLFDVSMVVFWQNPIFGDFHFVENPVMEQMRQGQGLIDIVNTYLYYALQFGSVGAGLFCASLLLPLLALWKARRHMRADHEAERLGRALLGTMVGMLLTIITASSIGAIGTLYWLFAGLCAAYARCFQPQAGGIRAAPPTRDDPGRLSSPVAHTTASSRRALRAPR